MPFVLNIISRKDIRAYVRDELDGEGKAAVERALACSNRAREICEQERQSLNRSCH